MSVVIRIKENFRSRDSKFESNGQKTSFAEREAHGTVVIKNIGATVSVDKNDQPNVEITVDMHVEIVNEFNEVGTKVIRFDEYEHVQDYEAALQNLVDASASSITASNTEELKEEAREIRDKAVDNIVDANKETKAKHDDSGEDTVSETWDKEVEKRMPEIENFPDSLDEPYPTYEKDVNEE